MIERFSRLMALRLWICGEFLCIAILMFAGASHAEEVTEIPLPDDTGAIRVIDFLPSGKIAIATAVGGIFIGELPAEPEPVWQMFSKNGLDQPCGLFPGEKEGELYVLQRPELTLLTDKDNDGDADVYRLVSSAWALIGDAHSGASALTVDDEGNWLVALSGHPVVSPKNDVGLVRVRPQPDWASATDLDPTSGWIVQLNSDGTLHPVVSNAGGIRSMALQNDGELAIVSDLGPSKSPSLHFMKPSRKDEGTEDEETAPMELPEASIVMPAEPDVSYGIGNPVIQTDDKLAFAGQWFLSGAVSGLFRVMVDEIGGKTQGAVTDFLSDHEQLKDVSQLKFDHENGTLFAGTEDGRLIRMAWPKTPPFCVTDVHLTEFGFELGLSEEVGRGAAAAVASYQIERGDQKVLIDEVVVEPDGLRVLLKISPTDLRPGSVYRITAAGVRTIDSDLKLSHGPLYYTLNQAVALDGE